MWFEDFQDGCRVGYCNGMVLAILNLYVTPMPPSKFQLNPMYNSGDVENVKKLTTDNRPWHKLTWIIAVLLKP